jgi:hypothetical protein
MFLMFIVNFVIVTKFPLVGTLCLEDSKDDL